MSYGSARAQRRFYTVLGVTKTATTAEIRKAYKTLARTHHPDKGGDPERFKELTKAHEVLSDSQKRLLYDTYGEEAVNGHGHGMPMHSGATTGTGAATGSSSASASSSSNSDGRFFRSARMFTSDSGGTSSKFFRMPDLFDLFMGLPSMRMHMNFGSGGANGFNNSSTDNSNSSSSNHSSSHGGNTGMGASGRTPQFSAFTFTSPRSNADTEDDDDDDDDAGLGVFGGSGSRAGARSAPAPSPASGPSPGPTVGSAASGPSPSSSPSATATATASAAPPPDVIFVLDITLRELYACASKKLKIRRTVVCYGCNGLGGHQNKCGKCGGTGSFLNTMSTSASTSTSTGASTSSAHANGASATSTSSAHNPSTHNPGNVSNNSSMRVMCDHCNLTGFVLDPICSVCKGQQTLKVVSVVTVQLRPGQDMSEVQRIPMSGTGIEDSGHLQVHLRELPDTVFQHLGDHLLVRRPLSLADALTGTQFVFEHLDQRQFVVQTSRTVKPNQMQVLRGYGMPRTDGSTRGNLYFAFDVQFPDQLADDVKFVLRNTLPGASTLPTSQLAPNTHVATLESDDGALPRTAYMQMQT